MVTPLPVYGLDFGTSSTVLTVLRPPPIPGYPPSYDALPSLSSHETLANPMRNPIPSTLSTLSIGKGPFTAYFTPSTSPESLQTISASPTPHKVPYSIGSSASEPGQPSLKTLYSHSPHTVLTIQGYKVKAEDAVRLFLSAVLFSSPDRATDKLLSASAPTTWPTSVTKRYAALLRSIEGVSDVKIIREPVAASLAYGRVKGKVLVVDIGGGTTDVALVSSSAGGREVVRVRGARFGGDNVDGVMEERWGKVDGGWKDRKHELCGCRRWGGNIGGLVMGDYVPPVDTVSSGDITVNRGEFVTLVEEDILPKIIEVARDCIKEGKCGSIALVGGGSNLPGEYH